MLWPHTKENRKLETQVPSVPYILYVLSISKTVEQSTFFEIEFPAPLVNLTSHETIARSKAVSGRSVATRPACFRWMPKARRACRSSNHSRHERLVRFRNQRLGSHRSATETPHRQTLRRRRTNGGRIMLHSPRSGSRHDVPQKHGHKRWNAFYTFLSAASRVLDEKLLRSALGRLHWPRRCD